MHSSVELLPIARSRKSNPESHVLQKKCAFNKLTRVAAGGRGEVVGRLFIINFESERARVAHVTG